MTFADPQSNMLGVNTFTTGSNPHLGSNQNPSAGFVAGGVGTSSPVQLSDYKIIRRNGAVVGFEPSKIAIFSGEWWSRCCFCSHS